MANISKSAGEIKSQARESMKGNTGKCIGAVVLYFVISMVINIIPVIGTLASIVLTGPLMLGLDMFFLGIIRNQSVSIEKLFDGFNYLLNSFLAYILMIVFILLWMLLLIIPGLVKALAYSMTFYILADNPEMKPLKAIEKSKELMQGNKYELFVLGLSFIGWFLLGILTLGLGFLWIIPYMNASIAHFYNDIKESDMQESQNNYTQGTKASQII